MIIDQINLNHLRIFISVFKNKSMTKAAEELFMTQSGISQHIKHLEDILELKLFDRVKHKLIPTGKAELLYEKASLSLSEIENTILEIKGEEDSLRGLISIGVPIEFGNNIVAPMVAEFGKKYPDLRFKFEYGYAAEMNDLLIDGKLDFAFVDDYALDKHIRKEKVYLETLELVATPEYIGNRKFNGKEDRKFFENLEYIRFNERDNMVISWMKHHFKVSNFRPKIRATLMDIEGAARLMTGGLGACILPDHMIQKLERRGVEIHKFKGSDVPLNNSITLAYVESRSHSKAILECIDYLKNQLMN